MKKYNLGIALFTILLLCACTHNTEDIFDESSSQRISESAKNFKELLTKPQNGWVMEYYPNSKQKYGGYEFTMKFDNDDNVAVSGELFGDAETSKSSKYSVKKDMSVTLNFDTYNPIFNYLSDPDPHYPGIYSPYGYRENGLVQGMGYEGDYEFVLQSATEYEIVLLGKKTLNTIRMYPLKEDSKTYLEKVIDMKKKLLNVPAKLGYSCELNGKNLDILYDENAGRCFKVVYGDEYMGDMSMLPTAEGLKSYKPFTVDGITLQNFSFADNMLTCIDNKNTISFAYKDNPLYLSYEDFLGSYKLAFDRRTVSTSTIEPLEEGKTLLLGGLNTKYKAVLQYDSIKGTVSICSQIVQTVNERDIWLCSFDANSERFTWNVNTGMVTEWNGDRDNFVLSFIDNKAWGSYTVTGFYYYSFDKGTFSNGDFYDGYGNKYACEVLKTLTKK